MKDCPPTSGRGLSSGVVFPSHTEHGKPGLPMPSPNPGDTPIQPQPCPGRVVVGLLWAGEALTKAKQLLRAPTASEPLSTQPPLGGSAGLKGAIGPSLPGCWPCHSRGSPGPQITDLGLPSPWCVLCARLFLHLGPLISPQPCEVAFGTCPPRASQSEKATRARIPARVSVSPGHAVAVTCSVLEGQAEVGEG